MNTIEEKTSKTILEDPITVTVGSKLYGVKPLTLATMIRISEFISTLPMINVDKNGDNVLKFVLSSAKDFRVVSSILAVGILGEKRCYGVRRYLRKIRLRMLAKEIENTCDAKELYNKLLIIINQMQVADFFALTTFLLEANMTKKTKVD